MALTKVTSTVIADDAITSDKISADVSLGVKIANVQIANSSYTVLDDTAVDVAGGYIIINGAGFASGAQVLIEGTAANSVTFVSSSQLKAQIPAKSAASYNLYVVNTDGSTGIRVNGVTYSATPTWVTSGTLDNQAVDVAFSVALDATGAVSYANSTALPAGTDLLSNGYFYGTVTGIVEETTYNFTVVATDAENQDSPRTFSVTVTVGPNYVVYVFGANNFGQLGFEDSITKSSPTQVGTDTTWDKIGTYGYSNLTTKTDGTLWSWGSNGNGQLGLNDTINRSSPTQIGSSTTWNYIDSGYYNGAAIKTDGTLWIWGRMFSGNLGLNDGTISKSSPTQVGSDTNWSSVSLGLAHTLAIKTNGTLWSWGYNQTYGALGNPDKVDKSSPTQIGSDTNWSKINCGQPISAAIKTNGTLWTWGWNPYGILGHNDTISKSSPVQVGNNTNWKDIGNMSEFAIATKTDGTIWGWGRNNVGQAGHDDLVTKSSPTQIGTGTNWDLFDNGDGHVLATKSDGTLWSWGYNGEGRSGRDDLINRPSPTQVGTSVGWNKVAAGVVHSITTKEV